MLKFSLTRETKEELVELNNKLEKTLKHINSIEDFQLDACKMLNRIEQFQRDSLRIVCLYVSTPIDERAKVNEKMRFTKENVWQEIEKWFDEPITTRKELRDRIDELDDTPEKVAVPEFIANYLCRAKTDVGLMRVFEIANTKNELEKWKKEYNWIRKNSEKFAKSWIDGYTIKQ